MKTADFFNEHETISVLPVCPAAGYKKSSPFRESRHCTAVPEKGQKATQISKISQSSSTFLQADSTFSMVA